MCRNIENSSRRCCAFYEIHEHWQGSKFPIPHSSRCHILDRSRALLKGSRSTRSKRKTNLFRKNHVTISHEPPSLSNAPYRYTIHEQKQKPCSLKSPLGYAVAAAAALSVPNPFLLQFQAPLGNSDTQEQDQKSLRKQLKETARISRAKFSNIKSDALTVAYALYCFENSQNQSEFCTNYALHLKTMEEMSKLRAQLLHLVFQSSFRGLEREYLYSAGTQQDVENSWRIPTEKTPLSTIEEDVLLRAICAGWVDRVAKRIMAASYQASMVKERVFLHRWSSVSSSAPEFLVYSELLHTKRPYIHGASYVASEWLVQYASSMCTFSAPLTDPKPGYDYHTDRVYCHVVPYFGPHSWQLPYHKKAIDDVTDRVAVFAYALLDGQVLPCLKFVSECMAARPSVILKKESLGEKRVGNLISKLNSRTIDKCSVLKEVWMENPMELYAEIRCWFQAGFHGQFDELWAKMQSEALLSPQDRFSPKSKKRKSDHIETVF